MVVSCSVMGCTNRWKKDLLFHGFPLKNADLLKKWLIAVKREKWKPTIHSTVCSSHFTSEDYRHGKGKKRWLKSEAVPSIFRLPSSKKKLGANRRKLKSADKKTSPNRTLPLPTSDTEIADSESTAISIPNESVNIEEDQSPTKMAPSAMEVVSLSSSPISIGNGSVDTGKVTPSKNNSTSSEQIVCSNSTPISISNRSVHTEMIQPPTNQPRAVLKIIVSNSTPGSTSNVQVKTLKIRSLRKVISSEMDSAIQRCSTAKSTRDKGVQTLRLPTSTPIRLRKKIKAMQAQRRRLLKKVTKMKEIIKSLKAGTFGNDVKLAEDSSEELPIKRLLKSNKVLIAKQNQSRALKARSNSSLQNNVQNEILYTLVVPNMN